MDDRTWPLVVACLVALALSVGLTAVLPDGGERVLRGGDGGEPLVTAEDFLADYERSRTVSFVAGYLQRRTLEGGRTVEERVRRVQDPPGTSVVVSTGTIRGRLDGVLVRCGLDPAAPPTCQRGEPQTSYAEDVAAEVDALRMLTTGERPRYTVGGDDEGCYVLTVVDAVYLNLDLGLESRYCFDEASGAPTRIEVRKEGAVDLIEATSIRTEVRPSDLPRLPD